MKNKQLITEHKRLQELAGIKAEKKLQEGEVQERVKSFIPPAITSFNEYAEEEAMRRYKPKGIKGPDGKLTPERREVSAFIEGAEWGVDWAQSGW